MHNFRVNVYKGKAILPFIDKLAELRMTIFREYPYLYDGDLDYEANYLKTYAKCVESVVVIIFGGDKVIGASTAVPLMFETAECQQPFIDHHIKVDEIFYLGESLLLPEYRGKKFYRHFFTAREQAARDYGAKTAAFCAVDRDADDLRKPDHYQPLDAVWQHFGYEKHHELRAYYEWKEIGEVKSSPKPLTFWLKDL